MIKEMERKTILVASDEELQNNKYMKKLKAAVRLFRIDQNEWKDLIQNMLLFADGAGYRFYFPDGQPYDIPLVDDVWKNADRYIRDFMMYERCKHIERARLIDLYFRVMIPTLAETLSLKH